MKKTILVLMFIVGLFLCINLVSSLLLTDGLVSYYDLNEAASSSGPINDSLLLNEATNNGVTNVTGKIGDAYLWDADSEYISKASFTNLPLGNEDFTYCMWVYPTTWAADPWIMGYGNADTAEFFGISWRETSNKLKFELHGVATDETINGMELNDWNFICLTNNGSSQILYINASVESTATETLDIQDSTFYIGTEVRNVNTGSWRGRIDEFVIWNRSLTQEELIRLYNNRDALPFPFLGVTVELTSPENNAILSDIGTNFTATYSSIDYNLTNATYYIYNSTGIFNNSIFVEITGNTNSTTEFIDNFVLGDYEWNVYACFENATFSDCEFAFTNFSFTIVSNVTSSTYNSTTWETARENFIINITNVFATPTNAILWYNGTEYTATITNIAGDNYTINRNLIIPIGTGNKTFYFKWDSGTTEEQSDNYSQIVNQTLFGLCNSTLNVSYLNFTFRDEEDNSAIDNGTIATSTFSYWLGDGTVNKTYTYINNTANPSYTFCGIPPDRNLTIDLIVQYEDQEGTYPQRIYDPPEFSLGNVTLNQTLYLLSATDGIYVTFQVINQAEQVIEGVVVTGTRTINGETVTVAYGTTGADGGVTFWLNPDFSHTFTFVATGYDIYITTLTPTQSSYTIKLSGGITAVSTDLSRGISYIIRPRTTELINDTTYNFNYTLNSTYWEVTEFGFILRLENGTILGSISASTNGGIVSLNQNTGNYSSIIMDYYYVIDGNYTNSSRYWVVYNTDQTEWSIRTFFTDLNTYLSAGIFGLDDFGLHLIVYIIIFISVGIMSYKYGLVSPIAISTIIFGVIYFFDVVVELLPNPIDAITHFPTLASAVVLVVLILKEVMR